MGVQGVSHLANVPINRRLAELTPDAIPADWDDPRPRWRSWHDLRTVLAVGAAVASSAAVGL